MSWGITTITDRNRDCGCNSMHWVGAGIYYGGFPWPHCNSCNCNGGSFSGYKSNSQQKGNLPSVGLNIFYCSHSKR